MIVGAAVIPTAPLLVRGISATLPTGVGAVRRAVEAAVAGLAEADVAVLVAAGDPGLYDSYPATLAGVGRPDLTQRTEVCHDALTRIAAVTGCGLRRGVPLPLGLAVLTMMVGARGRLVPLAVAATGGFEALAAIGAGSARALADSDVRAVLVAAGDLSAGLTKSSPLYRVDGAAAWDEEVLALIAAGRLDGLARLGPAQASRVGALGWAPMVVLHGACARAGLRLSLRHYSAPRGVGYLVADGG